MCLWRPEKTASAPRIWYSPTTLFRAGTALSRLVVRSLILPGTKILSGKRTAEIFQKTGYYLRILCSKGPRATYIALDRAARKCESLGRPFLISDLLPMIESKPRNEDPASLSTLTQGRLKPS